MTTARAVADAAPALRARLDTGLAAAGLRLSDGAADALVRYLELLARWNAVHNLTAVRDPADMVGRHLLDSLAGLPWLHGPTVLDAGTGAGLPGLPLAAARPDLGFTLVDTSRKRTGFVQHAAAQLGLRNVRVIQADVAALSLPEGPPACILARALAPLERLLAQLAPLCGTGTRLLAWRTDLRPAERAAVAAPWRVRVVHRYSVPDLDGTRVIVELDREAA